jgi:hypothetical protein
MAEIRQNIDTLAHYLASGSGPDYEFSISLVRVGICFVVTERDGEPFFAPSRFAGYAGNSRLNHVRNKGKHGRDTNPAISERLGHDPRSSQKLDEQYREFCHRVGIRPNSTGAFGISRKFWDATRII